MIEIRTTGIRRAASTGRRFIAELLTAANWEMRRTLEEIQEEASAYPPETEANRPKYGSYGPYYIRGQGKAYKSQDGGVNVALTSEQLGGSWEIDMASRGGDVLGAVGPTASYGPYVHDERQQLPIHGKRGWKTIQSVARGQRRRAIVAGFRELVRRTLRRLT